MFKHSDHTSISEWEKFTEAISSGEVQDYFEFEYKNAVLILNKVRLDRHLSIRMIDYFSIEDSLGRVFNLEEFWLLKLAKDDYAFLTLETAKMLLSSLIMSKRIDEWMFVKYGEGEFIGMNRGEMKFARFQKEYSTLEDFIFDHKMTVRSGCIQLEGDMEALKETIAKRYQSIERIKRWVPWGPYERKGIPLESLRVECVFPNLHSLDIEPLDAPIILLQIKRIDRAESSIKKVLSLFEAKLDNHTRILQTLYKTDQSAVVDLMRIVSLDKGPVVSRLLSLVMSAFVQGHEYFLQFWHSFCKLLENKGLLTNLFKYQQVDSLDDLIVQKFQLLLYCYEKMAFYENHPELCPVLVKKKKSLFSEPGDECEEETFFDPLDDGRSHVASHDPDIWDPGPMTSDWFSVHQGAILAADPAVKTKVLTAQLVSDMQAFKAANPAAGLADFVRWHSPKDWADGCLSKRMSEPGNLWQELWEACEPAPITAQRALFDPYRESEKCLFFFEDLKYSQLAAFVLNNYPLLYKHQLDDLCQEYGVVGKSGDLFEYEGFCAVLFALKQLFPSSNLIESMANGEKCLISDQSTISNLQSLPFPFTLSRQYILEGKEQNIFASLDDSSVLKTSLQFRVE